MPVQDLLKIYFNDFEITDKNTQDVLISVMKKKIEPVKQKNQMLNYFLGIYLVTENLFDQALLLFNSCIKSGSEFGYHGLGLWYYYQSKYAEAEHMFKEAIKRDCIHAHYELAILYKNQGKYIEYFENLKQGYKHKHKSAGIQLGKYYMDLRDFEKAEAILLDCADEYHSDAYYYLGNLQYFMCAETNLDMGICYYLKGYEYNNVECAFTLGLYYFNKQEWQDAEKFMRYASGKSHYLATIHLSKIYEKQNKIMEAEQLLQTLFKQRYTDAYHELGLFYIRRGDAKRAKVMFKIGIKEQIVECYYGYARFQENKYNYGKAIKYYNMILNYPKAVLRLVNILMVLKQYNTAKNAARLGIKLNIKQCYLLYGICLKKTDKYKLAKKYFKKGVESGDSACIPELLKTYIKLNKTDTAEKTLQQFKSEKKIPMDLELKHL